MRRHRPPPIVRFARLGLPDLTRDAPPDYRMSWRERLLLIVVYTLAALAIGALLLGLGLVRVP